MRTMKFLIIITALISSTIVLAEVSDDNGAYAGLKLGYTQYSDVDFKTFAIVSFLIFFLKKIVPLFSENFFPHVVHFKIRMSLFLPL